MIISAAVAIAEARMGKPGEKYYSGRSRAIMERAYIAFKSSTWMIVISGFVEPVLFLLSFGYGLKDLVGDITIAGQPIGYVAFIAPALLATSAMNGAIYDSTMNVFFKLNHERIYHGMLSTSLGPMDVALGEISWALLRGFSYAVGFMALVTPLGLIPSAWGILAIPAAVLIAFGFASDCEAVITIACFASKVAPCCFATSHCSLERKPIGLKVNLGLSLSESNFISVTIILILYPCEATYLAYCSNGILSRSPLPK